MRSFRQEVIKMLVFLSLMMLALRRSFRKEVIKMLAFLSLMMLGLTVIKLIAIPNQTAFHEESDSNFREIILDLPNLSQFTLKGDLPTADSIVIHPYSSDYLMTGFVIPHDSMSKVSQFRQTGTVSGTLSGGKLKRAVTVASFVAFKLALNGAALIGTFYSCKGWSEEGTQWYDPPMCVVTAVTATLAIGTSSIQVGVYAKLITEANHPWLMKINQALNRKKRSMTTDGYMGNLTELTVAFASLTGLPTATLIRSNMDIALNDQTGYPIHVVLTPDGQLLHVSLMRVSQESWTFRVVDPSIYNTTLTKKSKDFNMENFSQEGIEARVDYEKAEQAQMSPQYAWTHMTDQVRCYLGDMSGNAYQYQVFDNDHGETLSAGTIRAFSDESFGQFTIAPSYVNWPMWPRRPECEVS